MKTFLLILLLPFASLLTAQCNASFNHTILTNGMVTFNNTSTPIGGNYFTHWDFGDGNLSSAYYTSFNTYTTNGTYTVCLAITDSITNCTDTSCYNITITNANTPCSLNSTFSYVNNGIGNLSITNNSSGNYNYKFWDFGDGNTSNAQNPNHTYSNNGSYKVCLTIMDSLTNCSDTHCDTIIITNASGINCNYTPIADTVSNTMTFEFSCVSNGSSYFWDFGDGNTSSSINPTHVYQNPGWYTYCLTVDNCPMVCNTINALDCYSNFIHSPDSFNTALVNVTNLAQGSPLNYFWDFGDGNTSTMAYPQHTYTASGTYFVCLTVDDGINCSDTYCDSISGGQIIKQAGFTINVTAPFSTEVELVKDPVNSFSVYPNPASNKVNIDLTLDNENKLKIEVRNILGKVIKSFDNDRLTAGSNKLIWDATRIPSGIYFINVSGSSTNLIKKVIVNQ